MDDLISRQAAIYAIKQAIIHSEDEKLAVEALEELPSAQPEIRYYGQFEIKDPVLISEWHWIPCSERLPELNDDGASDPVLLCWADRQIVVGFYAGNETFYAQSFPFASDGTARITAWMPLPDPYKEEE